MFWFILVMLNTVAGVTSSIYIVSIFQCSTCTKFHQFPLTITGTWLFAMVNDDDNDALLDS
jgi:hypothetical protein